MGRRGDKGTRGAKNQETAGSRQGAGETETGRQGDKERGRQGDTETRRTAGSDELAARNVEFRGLNNSKTQETQQTTE